MSYIRKSLFFYFYLKQFFKIIRHEILHRDSPYRYNKKDKLPVIIRKVGIAALTTLVVYTIFLYLNHGLSFFSRDGLASLGPMIIMELILGFLFLLVIFLSHSIISSFATSEKFKKLNPVVRSTAEAFMVIVSTIVTLTLVNYLPLFLMYPEIDPNPKNLRIGYVVSAIISMFFYYYVERERYRKQLQAEMLRSARLQKENYQAQLEGLKNQVNPHFLFNSLNVLRTLIPQDQDRAMEFTSRLSELYRSFLDYGAHQLIPLSQELTVARSYIYLLETRFGEAVHFEIDIPEKDQNLLLPPGCLQMLVENAIKHNGSTRKNPLQVNIYSEGGHLIVKNNLQPRLEEVTSTRTGLANIRSRYKYLSDQKVITHKTEKDFLVKLPLLKAEKHESIDY